MFVRVKKIGAYEYLYLVENAREGGRHVQRVVKALGRRDEVEASGMLDALVASAARHSRRSIVLSRFYRGELAELRRVSIGPDLVFGRLSNQLPINYSFENSFYRPFGEFTNSFSFNQTLNWRLWSNPFDHANKLIPQLTHSLLRTKVHNFRWACLLRYFAAIRQKDKT